MNLIKPNKVIFHCSDTGDYSKDHPSFDIFGAKEIKIWHLERGFSDIGYHFVIRRTGIIEIGRYSDEKGVLPGAHCRGENRNSIGICYIGKKIMTEEQIKSMKNLYMDILEKYGITYKNWFCHNQFNNLKTCPGFSVDELQKMLLKK